MYVDQRPHLPLIHDQVKALATDGAGRQVSPSLQHALCAAGITHVQPATGVAEESLIPYAGEGLQPVAGVLAACTMSMSAASRTAHCGVQW